MKSLSELLRAADPLNYEDRTVQDRDASRRFVLNAPRLAHRAPTGRLRMVAILALTMIGAAWGVMEWSRATVSAIAARRFEMRLAEEQPRPGLQEATVRGTGQKVYLYPDVLLENKDIARASVIEGHTPTTFGVMLAFTRNGGTKMIRALKEHRGAWLAMLIDGEVVTVPRVRQPATPEATVSGHYTKEEAERIVAGIIGR